jgi:outer membrane protein TolC
MSLLPLIVAIGLIVGSMGCSMSASDKRITRLLDQYADQLGPSAMAPRRDFPPADEFRSPDQLDEDPETVNPSVDDLEFEEAPGDRDAALRLDAYALDAISGTPLDLSAALRISQTSSREFLNAEEEYVLAAIRLLIERHRFGPRFFNDTRVAIDGNFDTTNNDTAITIVNELRATQQLPYGGNVEASLIWNAAELLREEVSGEYSSATELALNANIPLLRDAGPIAKESLIQAERDMVYAARAFERFRREFLVDISRDYFDLVAQLAGIANQQRTLASLLQSQERTAARVAAGREAAFQTRRFEENVLNQRNSLIRARENYILLLDRFKVRLGIPVTEDVLIVPTEIRVPEPEITTAEAARTALQFRLDLQTRRDRLDDSRRAVANSKNQLLPDLDLAGGIAVATDSADQYGDFDFDFKETDYNASVTFGLPLDREIERLNLRSSIINMERNIRGYEEFRDNVIVDARASVRAIDQARFALELAGQRVEINQLVLEQLKLEEAESLEITTAESDLLQSENDRDLAIRDLRVAVLEYLLETGQLRVTREGGFDPIPGMGPILLDPGAVP